ncbi:hypothetical protein [Nocardia cerradoensis]|nr:hypothetical protein [Nocardia cerradoensis]
MFIVVAVKNIHEKVLSDKESRQVVRLRTFRPEKACSAGRIRSLCTAVV